MNGLIRHVAFVLAALSLVVACSSNEVAPATAQDAAPTTCELHDGACSAGCCPQPGNRYDPARECNEGREQVIGCAPMPASTSACALFGIVGCAVTPAGTFFTSGLAPGWTDAASCGEMRDKVLRAKVCTTADAGVD